MTRTQYVFRPVKYYNKRLITQVLFRCLFLLVSRALSNHKPEWCRFLHSTVAYYTELPRFIRQRIILLFIIVHGTRVSQSRFFHKLYPLYTLLVQSVHAFHIFSGRKHVFFSVVQISCAIIGSVI